MRGHDEVAFRVNLDATHEEALTMVTEALRAEGFGILTLVDMQKTLREKLGVEFRKYTILGVCNPPLANRALDLDLDAGLVLPCSVVVCEQDKGTSVSIADPRAVVGLLSDEALHAVAEEAREKLMRAMDSLRDTGS
jgi:uncharacterized protein (DUF302 family)